MRGKVGINLPFVPTAPFKLASVSSRPIALLDVDGAGRGFDFGLMPGTSRMSLSPSDEEKSEQGDPPIVLFL
jgi:hypothetical protein